MAKTKGPLFSIDASGTVANAIVFSKWKGRNYVRRHTIPLNPQTENQVNVRTAMKLVVALWVALPDEVKATWNTFAKPYQMSGFNTWTSRAMKEYVIQLTTAVTPLSVEAADEPPNETWTWAPVV